MEQMIKDIAPEVKKEKQTKSHKKDVVHRYIKRLVRTVGETLSHRTQEECLSVLNRVGEYQRFPGTLLTNVYEAASFYEIDSDVIRSKIVRQHSIVDFVDNRTEFPVMHVKDFAREIGQNCPDSKYVVSENIIFVGNEDVALRIGNLKCNHNTTLVSPKGMIILAYSLANGLSEDNRQIAKFVVDECERSGLFGKEEVAADASPGPEPDPAPEAPEPRLDPGQTLTRMFASVLHLFEKQAEERGAEKVIQALRDAGKL